MVRRGHDQAWAFQRRRVRLHVLFRRARAQCRRQRSEGLAMADQSALRQIDWPEDIEPVEPSINSSVYFTGIRAAVVDGVAHQISTVRAVIRTSTSARMSACGTEYRKSWTSM